MLVYNIYISKVNKKYMQKIIKSTIITTTVITLLWSIVGQTFIPACANLSIVLIIALLTD